MNLGIVIAVVHTSVGRKEGHLLTIHYLSPSPSLAGTHGYNHARHIRCGSGQSQLLRPEQLEEVTRDLQIYPDAKAMAR